MPLSRPVTTLFMLMSLDGKISTGDQDILDVDKDFPKIKGVREGLYQYYDLERHTDIYSFNTGRVQAKIGINTRKGSVQKIPVRFILIDNKPHLRASGIEYFLKRGKMLYIVTTNPRHPAFKIKNPELKILYYPRRIDFKNLFNRFKKEFGVKRITLQSGGTLNAVLLREGLIDRISVVVAPILIGGKNTSTLIDGESLHTLNDLRLVKPLKLQQCKKLKNSYLHLIYKVLNT
ncbi:MAG: dihydrofolate reductase family protein [Nanoarchaeota archaeon]